MSSLTRSQPPDPIASRERAGTLLLRFGVAAGWLKPGEPLPPLRSLALQVSLNSRLLTGGRTHGETQAAGLADHQARLEVLCTQFMAYAARHGFSPHDTYRSIQALLERS